MKLFSYQNIYFVFFTLFVTSLSFSKALPNIFFIVLIILFIYDSIKNGFYKNKNYLIKIGTPFLVLTFYLTVKSIINNAFYTDISITLRFLIIIILPFLLLKIRRNKLFLMFITSAFIAMLIALYNTFIFYSKSHFLPFEQGEIINEILIIDRPYLGFFCLIASILCLYLSNEILRHKKKFILLSIILILFILLIAARLAVISAIIVSFVYLFFYSKYSFFKKLLYISISTLLIFFVVISNNNLKKRLLTNLSVERFKYYDARVDIWDCAYRHLKSDDFNVFIGTKSYVFIENKLIECYKSKFDEDLKKRSWFVDSKFNTHNQFLDFYLVGGLIGLILFVVFVFYLVKTSIHNFYFFSIVLSLILFFVFENVFHRQFGCYLIAIIISILNTKSKEKKIILIKN